ncbi:hypothetical protein [Actinomycetospora callitridis]|uniref:hypothetical protein n=1 Tax=Actinomycetospora callitridis TaxID=913944 RepID=UPI00236534D8|nr:hypothetical protein [Actinomycetospora callitridis]MDD7920147.1 hypothetical protein [Actinomycetospora callitridis]
MSSTDSGYVSRYAQWLSTGDQDLNPLRNTPQFVDFLDRYFPNQGPRVLRPQSQLVKLVMSMHTSRLLTSFCDRRAQFWYRHTDEPIERGVADELMLEAPVTSLVADYVEHDRHWQTRMALLKEADEFCCRWGLGAVEDTFPTFQEDPQVLLAADDPGKLKRLSRNADGYFRDEVISVRSDTLDALLPIARQRAAELRDAEAEPSRCLDFWLEMSRRLRAGLGIPEEEHRGVAERRKRALAAMATRDAVSPMAGAVPSDPGD